MRDSGITRIHARVRAKQYDMSAHAMEEMAEDNLDIEDIEAAMMRGRIVRIDRDDPRGTKYVIMGRSIDGITPVGVVVRLTSTGRMLIITVYEITETGV